MVRGRSCDGARAAFGSQECAADRMGRWVTGRFPGRPVRYSSEPCVLGDGATALANERRLSNPDHT